MAEHGAEVRLLRDALEEIVDDLCSQMALEGEGE
jgi:N-acetylglutamate synthase/N-acetylornithine aminotransferase